MPHFRDPDGKPAWAKEEPAVAATIAEQSATVPKPAHRPRARLDGSGTYVDGITGWIADEAEQQPGHAEQVRP